ncbi:hypothetical protein T03_15811 [Trichinella britovi]|uniref:Uncharacterized protein n=1 Tax=Trichinella britovi TaxID=45882 RepID=A0A0V1CI09_TRIBR|nr:hypothetical protein T03_15811 [Trichinella britovi]
MPSRTTKLRGCIAIPYFFDSDDNEDLIPSIIIDSVQSSQLEQLPYKKTKDEVKFDEERYVVKLPWKTPEVRIPNNYEQAEQRLQQLEKRLNYNNERAKEYNEKTALTESDSGHPDTILRVQDWNPSGHLKDVPADTARPRR